jgi:hypothetical protein
MGLSQIHYPILTAGENDKTPQTPAFAQKKPKGLWSILSLLFPARYLGLQIR